MPRLSFVGYVPDWAIESRHNLLLLLVTRPTRPPGFPEKQGCAACTMFESMALLYGARYYPVKIWLPKGKEWQRIRMQRMAQARPEYQKNKNESDLSVTRPRCHSKKPGAAILRRCKFQTRHDREKEPWKVS